VNFRDIFLKNGPPGCAGAAQPTGWMVEETFKAWFCHFLNHVHPSADDPLLLILDNHETHMSIESIDMASENGVVVLTIPPHTSHKLQTLDITVYGPFKRLYNLEMGAWLDTTNGKPVTIYDIAEISGKVWTKAAMPANIISGFAASGLHPFQPDQWKDEDFCLAELTDRQNPQSTRVAPIPAISDANCEPAEVGEPSTSADPVTPMTIRPLPKAGARQQQTKGRKR